MDNGLHVYTMNWQVCTTHPVVNWKEFHHKTPIPFVALVTHKQINSHSHH